MKMNVRVGEKGKYICEGTLGRGGICNVFLARECESGKRYALKEIIKTEKEAEKNICIQMLENEINVLTLLGERGNAFPAIRDRGEDFYVMDILDGECLKKGSLSGDEVIEKGKELCRILSLLQEQYPMILHLDIKPSNIIQRKNGGLCLIDFGSAKVLRNYENRQNDDSAVISGTRTVAAPEQYGGMFTEDGRTDIYLLGQTMEKLLAREKTSPFLEKELSNVFLKCTELKPECRYRTPMEVWGALESCKKKARIETCRFIISMLLGSILFALSAFLILYGAKGYISMVYGAIAFLLGRFIWNSKKLACDIGMLKAHFIKNSEIEDELFIDIVMTCDTIEL